MKNYNIVTIINFRAAVNHLQPGLVKICQTDATLNQSINQFIYQLCTKHVCGTRNDTKYSDRLSELGNSNTKILLT